MNPFGIDGYWKIDPDHRQDRGPGPMTVRQMTPEEAERYGAIKGNGQKPVMAEIYDMKRKGIEDIMALMTKGTVQTMAAQGMTVEEIVEHFQESYPKMKGGMLKARIVDFLGLGKKKEKKAEPAVTAGGGMAVMEDKATPVEVEEVAPVTETILSCKLVPTPTRVPKVYISTGWDRKMAAAKIARIVETFGGMIDVPWWMWPDEESREQLAQHAVQEAKAVQDCDLFICLLPGVEGTHTELGMALAWGKKVLLFGEIVRQVPFYYLDRVQLVGDEIEDLVIEIHKAMEAV